MELRNALRMLRSEIGMTQMEFATAVFVSFSTVNRWENKGMRPNRIQSKAILELAKQYSVSTSCLEQLTRGLMASRADDKEDKERRRLNDEEVKCEQRNLLTEEQFRKTMDHIDMALIGHRFYNRDPRSCDIFYYNDFFAESFGYQREEFDAKLRKDPLFLVAGESRKEVYHFFELLLAPEVKTQDLSINLKVFRKDKSYFWMELKAASVTEYSYGQEVFTFFRDITKRVEAEQHLKEEVLLRDVSMQIMFSNIHCNLTTNQVSRYLNLQEILGDDYKNESIDELLIKIADKSQDGPEKEEFLAQYNRAAFLRAYEEGRLFGSAVLFNKRINHWFRNDYLIVRNSVSGDIHVLVYMFDIQKQVLMQKLLGIMFQKLFDFVGIIDVEAETIEPYFYAEGVFQENYLGKVHYYPSVCEKNVNGKYFPAKNGNYFPALSGK